ncbi:MAG: heme-binding protein [Myxococcales bacterium]|nr:heme-binding protein [Myxococcales bacterium]
MGARLSVFAVLTWSALAMATESPKYEVLKKYDGFEVRQYAGFVVAETEVEASRGEAGNQAFGRLGGYIFGGNTAKKEIAMTAPVTQSQRIAMTSPVTQVASGSKWVVQFSMPSSWTMQTLPVPNDARVTLREVAPKTMAVLRYSGTWSEANYVEHLDKLKKRVTAAGLTTVGEPVWARYDPPYTPWFMRTNEVQLELAPTPAP